MSKKHLVFLPYKLHLRHLLNELAEKMQVTVILPPEKSLPSDTKLHGIRISYLEFGANVLKPYVGREIRTLKCVRGGVARFLDGLDMSALVTFEFYHWYTFQCIAYKKRRNDFKLYVVSETKRWPRNIVARLIKRVLLAYFRRQITHIDGMYVYTEAAHEFLKQYIPEAHVTLLPTPIDVALFKPSTEKQFCPNGELRLLMNARFSPYKRHADLFAALLQLHQEGRRVRLTCISRNEWDREQLTALIDHMGVADVVDVLEARPQSEMPALYYAHDVLVLPSYNEAIGMVVPEAMACGLPTITSDTVGANVYVKHGETGCIYKTGDVSELTDCIRNYVGIDRLKAHGKNASAHIQTTFTPEAVARGFTSSFPSDL